MRLKYDIYKKKVENKIRKMLGDELNSLADTLIVRDKKRILKRLVRR